MQASTARLTAPDALRPRKVLRSKQPIQFSASDPEGLWGDVLRFRPIGGRFRAARRLVAVVLWTILAIPVQALLMLLPGRGAIAFGKVYHHTLCALMGLRLQVIGEPATGVPVLYVSNHTSWLDVLVLGATLEAAFVAKSEIDGWPLVNMVAKLGRTLFVSRRRTGTRGEADALRERLAGGDSVILFPEGTTSDGGRVLPFRSSFLSIADAARSVQPVSVVYDRLGGLPACRRDRPVFAWYGDTGIFEHFWRIARRSSARATIILHEPVDPAAYANRKALTAACAGVIAESCSTMRQNRPAKPLRAAHPALRA